MMRQGRRPTIISPAGHIRSFTLRPFIALNLAGCILASVAGFINTICVFGFFHSPVSAATGGTSRMILAFAQGDYPNASNHFFMITSFVTGNFLSGALVGGSSFRIERSYGIALIIEAILLVSAYFLTRIDFFIRGLISSLSLCGYFIAFACGLQNGLCTTFSGAVIRTTHVTGTLTDIGLIIGQAVFHSRTRKHLWKLKILVSLYLSFCVGGFIGWFSYRLLKETAILIPCSIVGILGLGHLVYWKLIPMFKAKRVNEKMLNSSELTSSPSPNLESQDADRELSNDENNLLHPSDSQCP